MAREPARTPEPPPEPAGAAAGGEDPSMEDILASIRRILSEDEAANAPEGERTRPPAVDEADVLPLDESMLVEEPEPPRPALAPPPSAARVTTAPPHAEIMDTPPSHTTDPEVEPILMLPPEHQSSVAPEPAATDPSGLVAPETAAAAASSVGALLRTLHVDRPAPMQVTRAGVTLEDIVRDELRPVVKAWLDQNLPSLVERMVRAEIERVMSRARED